MAGAPPTASLAPEDERAETSRRSGAGTATSRTRSGSGRSAGPRSARVRSQRHAGAGRAPRGAGALLIPPIDAPAGRPARAGQPSTATEPTLPEALRPDVTKPAPPDAMQLDATTLAGPATLADPATLAVPATPWSAPRVVDRRPAASVAAADGMRALRPRAARRATATPTIDMTPLRLTRRGLVVLGAIVLGAVIAVLAVARASAPQDPAAPASTPAAVTVHSGDTLWSIAAAIAPQRDPRDVVSDLRRLNGLDSVDLQPGQTIRTR